MIREIQTYLKSHWIHLILLIPMALVITFMHEAAHAAMVVIQGGKLIEFVCIPSPGEWGHVRYTFPPGTIYNNLLIALAPYFWSMIVFGVGIALSLGRWKFSEKIAGLIFVWLLVAPLGEVAYAAFQFAGGANNDFFSVFGAPTFFAQVLIPITALLSILALYPLQKRLYCKKALSQRTYCFLSSGVLVALLVAS